ncbi:hypothetical protein JR316_0013421 [Psilocybe cubensis]|uniref:Uncharacterized protein n=2 Tax=Psilocybe cubensis TaxID=181762 RepID=A0ACB8GF22_PSICU|nr:uncharacterized protein JR316_0013421 [Psilocybe cubensis]KAH9474258.1 hypothetical protein JR316_0013421 [Psilocybe cubensis]
MSDGAELIQKHIEFTELSAQYQELSVFTPQLPVGANWGYLGQVACTSDGDNQDHRGLIFLAKDGSDALGDIIDWAPVFIDIEQRRFSTWRGILADPERYVCGGDFFVLGADKPTAEQTAGIRAIRRDLVSERQPQRRIWEGRLPKAILSIWDIVVTDRLHVIPGTFASTDTDSVEGLTLPVVRFNA